MALFRKMRPNSYQFQMARKPDSWAVIFRIYTREDQNLTCQRPYKTELEKKICVVITKKTLRSSDGGWAILFNFG